MHFLAAAFLLLTLSASALAEPVHFRDCGEPRGQSKVPTPSAGPPPEPDAKTSGWVGWVPRAARLSLRLLVKWAKMSWGRGQGSGLDKTRLLTTLSLSLESVFGAPGYSWRWAYAEVS